VELPKGEHELVVRAWDSAGQTQPALPDDTWNFKGYLSAAWHRVLVSVS
jgi:sulfite oxidase